MEKNALETQIEDAAVQAGGLLRSRYGLWALAGISFIESALPVPIITDPFLIAYIIADKKSVYKGVIVTLVASVLGGVVSYIVAFSFYEFIVAQYMVGGLADQFNTIVPKLREGTFIMTILGAVTPIPYTLVAFGAGFVKGSLLMFIIASIIGRGGRYVLVGAGTYYFGKQALDLIRKRILLISIVFIFAAVLYFFFKW